MAQADLQADRISSGDKHFLSCFENCTLPEVEWTHLAHIRVAWLCLIQEPPELALARICRGILRYNTELLHRRIKYHETVTVAFARIVSDRMIEAETWEQFACRINDILDPEDPILMRYYSGEILFSEEARLSFTEPDIKDLPEFSTSLQGA